MSKCSTTGSRETKEIGRSFMRSLLASPSVTGQSSSAVSHLKVRGKTHPPNIRRCRLPQLSKCSKVWTAQWRSPAGLCCPKPHWWCYCPTVTEHFLVLVGPFVTPGCFPVVDVAVWRCGGRGSARWGSCCSAGLKLSLSFVTLSGRAVVLSFADTIICGAML